MQLMSDCPSHRLFALLGRVEDAADSGGVPDVLCVVRVALEGRIAAPSIRAAMAKGENKPGDLIPWTVSTQFQESSFAQLSGARVVRIAVHPDCMGMGYGSRALELLKRHYQGELYEAGEPGEAGDVDNHNDSGATKKTTKKKKRLRAEQAARDAEDAGWMQERMRPRPKLPPLCSRCGSRGRSGCTGWARPSASPSRCSSSGAARG